MEIVHELVRSATDPDPVSVSPGSLSRGEGKKPRAYNRSVLSVEFDAGESATYKRNARGTERLLMALRLNHGPVEAVIEQAPLPVVVEKVALPVPCYPVIPDTGLTATQSVLRTIKKIQMAVAHDFGMTVNQLLAPSRRRDITRPRQTAMYIAVQSKICGTCMIGRLFGDMDHTTVMHAVKRVKAFMASDPAYRARVEAIEARL